MSIRACIIGAGSSGIAAAKELRAQNIAFDCIEASDRVGGNWVYQNKNGMSACYAGLYINTSRTRMEYPGFPMPASYPDFPHHSQIAAYFESYVDHYGLRESIRFETKVERVEREGARFRVTTSRGDGERSGARADRGADPRREHDRRAARVMRSAPSYSWLGTHCSKQT